MGITDLSVMYVENRLLREVSVAVLAMSIKEFRQNAERMQRLLEAADQMTKAVSDTSLGNQIDLIA